MDGNVYIGLKTNRETGANKQRQRLKKKKKIDSINWLH